MKYKLSLITTLTSLLVIATLFSGCSKKELTKSIRSTSNPPKITPDQSAGSSVSVPAELAYVTGQIVIKEGSPVVSEATSVSLNIPEGANPVSAAINVSSDVNLTALEIGKIQIAIPLEAELGLLAADLVVFYKVRDENDKIINGVIPTNALQIVDDEVKFYMVGFGNYQTARVPVAITEAVQVETADQDILSKEDLNVLPTVVAKSLAPLVSYNGDTIVISGANFNASVQLSYRGKVLSKFELVDSSTIHLQTTELSSRGLAKLFINQNGSELILPLVYGGERSDFPVSLTSDEAQVCQGQKYYDAQGELKSGLKNCDSVSYSPCESDGAVGCLTTSTYVAALTTGLGPKVVSGNTVAGIVGSASAESHSACTAANQDGCVATTSFKTMNLSAAGTATGLTSANFNDTVKTAANFEFWDAAGTRHSLAGDSDLTAAKILSGESIFGVTGSATSAPANCSANGSQACVATGSYFAATACSANGSNCFVPTYAATTQPFKAISYDAIDAGKASIRSSLTLSGIAGTLADCASDGAAGCVVVGPTYAALLKTSAEDKILSGQTLAGVAGTVTLPAVAKVLSATAYGVGGSGSTGTLTLPSASNVLTGSSAYGEAGSLLTPSYSPDFPAVASVRASDTVNGASGTLGDCTAANQSTCVATASYKTMDSASATAATDLTSGNFNATVSTAANFEFWDSAGTRYQVMGDADLAAANILSGATVFGVSGSVTAAPANCSANGSQSCVATGTYFAATACAANNSDCYVPSYVATTQPLKAISYDAIDAGKASIRSSLTLSGIAGTLADCSAGNSSGCVTTVTYRSMDLSAAGSATGLTAANFQTRLASATSSEFWDASGARHSVVGDGDLSVDNLKAGVGIFGVTGQYPSASYPLDTNTAATDLTLFNTQLTTDGNFEFFTSAGVRYTGSGDSDLVNANVKNTIAIENLSITGTFVSPLVCPSNWIKVPGDSAYGTGDFCVMKYEAKNVTQATSQPTLTPWVSIMQTAAITACRALGTGYDIISNPQWMTIGANVAGINGNWSGGTVGSGSLFAGHNDSSPNAACAASSNDTDFYVETTCTAVSSGDTAEQRRTLTLSNSNVIWDLSGNVWEWVNYLNRGDKPGATAAWSEYTAVTGTTTTALKDLVPTNAVKAFWTDTWNSTKWIGQFYPGTNGTGGALERGGSWLNGSNTGVFSAYLNDAPSLSSAGNGFRCTIAPSP